MEARLAAGTLVSALIRAVEAAGGTGVVLAKGDPTAGALLIQLAERGVPGPLLERTLGSAGGYRWQPIGPAEPEARRDYLARRRRGDPDLWVVELDARDAAGIVAAVTG